MAQRRGVRRVSTLFECGAGRSQLLPTAPGSVNQDDVFGFGHETKHDSQGARQCPIRVKLFCRREAGGGCASSTMSIAISTARLAETLVLEGIAASIGSVGDAYDNALAETTIGLLETEAVGRGSPLLTGPLRTIDDVDCTAMEWVDWFNNRRLHSQLDYLPPEEYEAAYYAHVQTSQQATPQQCSRASNPGRFTVRHNTSGVCVGCQTPQAPRSW